ncbi:MAG TPA: hypothetical protein DCM45_03440 [Clostridiales bacterium]|nr:hypothetical protein [Clostridiales bacterium]
MNLYYKRFYLLSLAALLILSAYPLINGIRMAFFSIRNGAVEPEQYARYVVPYAAMCLAVLLFACFQPLLLRLKRRALPISLIGTYGIFIAIEQFYERIQIHTTGMALVDTATLTADPNLPTATIDIWQASLCIASPLTLGSSVAYASADRYLYVMGSNTYKIHYYLISLVLITMICVLIDGIGRQIREHSADRQKPLIMQGVATAALLSLCIFANTTAFFRQAGGIQTPLASILTSLFFVILGTAAGIYAGSFFLKKSSKTGLVMPIAVSLQAVVLMYIAEIAMMSGGLYRFGTSWFFKGLSTISLAPVDLFIILLTGAVTGLFLKFARSKTSWPGKKTAVFTAAACAMIAVIGVSLSAMPVQSANALDNDLMGTYHFDECLYMHPLSSFLPVKGMMPYEYRFGENSFEISDQDTGKSEKFAGQYLKTPVPANEFQDKIDLPTSLQTDLSIYKERWLRGVFTGDGQQYGLYQMDDELWLVYIRADRIWSIYRLQ